MNRRPQAGGFPPQGAYPPQGQGQGAYPPQQSPFRPARPPAAQQQQRPIAQQPRPVVLQQSKIADKTQEIRFIFGGLSAVSPNDFPPNPDGSPIYIRLIEIIELAGRTRQVDVVLTAQPLPGFPDGHISLSEPQRAWLQVGQADRVVGEQYNPFANEKQACLGAIDVEVSFARLNKTVEEPYDQDELTELMTRSFPNHVFQPGQKLLLDVRSIPLSIRVQTVTLMDLSLLEGGADGAPAVSDPRTRGLLTKTTSIRFYKSANSPLKLKASTKQAAANAIIGPDFKFEDLGIGGLDEEFTTIFRRAFASRILPPGLVEKLGIMHVKGILLHGPPGTGKTLIARQIGKMLNAREPKVINGPEVLNKFVGQSEENVRKLFVDAEKEYKEKGEESGLHVIIFDELDAVCKQRGSGSGGGTGVGDNVVNQLLAKLDGVEQLNNILLIGMTNRKDMIDEALLRPGRLELHLEIPIPDEAGRLAIFKIHTSKMRKNGHMSEDVDLGEIARRAKNYSGADIAGVIRAATGYGMMKCFKPGSTTVDGELAANMKIDTLDFVRALDNVKPALGSDDAELDDVQPFGIIHFSEMIPKILKDAALIVEKVRSQDMIRLTSVLVHGPPGSGKTAMAAHIAMQSKFPLIKIITPGTLLRFATDGAKSDYLQKVFTDAYKSRLSIVILDQIDDMLEWVPLGPRFSTTMLQTLYALLITKPPKGHHLLVLATTARRSVMDHLDLMRAFRGGEIPMPMVQDTRQLSRVLTASNVFRSPEEAQQVLNTTQSRMNSETVGLGVGAVLEMATNAACDPDPADRFAEDLAEEIERKNMLR